jgi:hypothetical protein
MCLRLPWQRHASSALVAHTAGGPRIAVHVQLHFFDNLLNDFITGDGRYSLLYIIQGLQKIRQFLADGSFLGVVTLALRIVLNSKYSKRKSCPCTNKAGLCAGS